MNRTTVNRRYKIERKIGEGGMAEVFLGYDELLHRPVAIKSLRPQYAADAGFRTRFEREAQAAASFSHPNIIDIYDVGEDRNTPYIVMEYVAGETLKEIIENEGPFDPDDVAILVEQVASALDYAHERGFVHRDIKPQNILVDADGLAKVVDFGIAKGLADSTLTAAGTGLGTVHYISPEQASGLMATPSSDIYSLAIVAYEMLANRLPFDSDSAVGVAMKHINDPPRHPSLINPDVPRQAGDIVMRALSKDPTKRFATAGAFASALNGWRTYDPNDDRSVPVTSFRPPIQPEAPASRPTPAASPTIEPAAGSPDPQRRDPSASQATQVVPAARAPRPPEPAAAMADEESHLGCASWIVGAGVIIGLFALVWFGSRLNDRLGNFGRNDDTPTATVETSANAALPTPTQRVTPTKTPTIAPIASTTPAEAASVAVPNLIGMAVDEAKATLDQAGLVYEAGNTETSDSVEKDHVASQDPAPDTDVDPGASVSVNLSSGPATIDLAALNLVGTDPADAQEKLVSVGLQVAQEQIASDISAGKVAGLQPPDEARPGDLVTILVSVGNRVQIAPELQGMPLEQAVATLEGKGLTVSNQIGVSAQTIQAAGIKDLAGAGIDDGDVVGIQDNGATFGGFVDQGASVTLVYYDASKDQG